MTTTLVAYQHLPGFTSISSANLNIPWLTVWATELVEGVGGVESGC